MNRKLLALVFGLAVIMIMTACNSGGNAKGNSPSSPSPTSPATSITPGEKTKLTYWTGDRHDAEFIKEVIDQYNETNEDNIEVELVVTGEYDQALDIAFVSGQSPDIFRAKENTIQTYYKKDYMEPLDDYLTDEMKEKFPQFQDFNLFDGKMYSLPNYGTTIRLIYNVELFEKAGIVNPPTTVQEMVEAAKKITEVGKSEGAYGFALNFKNPNSALSRSARVIAELSGYGGFGYDFNAGKYDFSGYKEIIEGFKQMMDDGSMLPGVESLDIDPLRAQFAEGKSGMYLSYSSEPGVYQNQVPAKIEWNAAPAPTVTGSVEGASGFLGGQWLAISKDSKHKQEAFKFLEYMYKDEVLVKYHEQGFGISMVPSVAASAQNPEINGIDGFLPTQMDGIWPLHPTVTIEGSNSSDEFFKYMIEGGDLDAIIVKINDRYNSALEKAKSAGEVEIEPMPNFNPKDLQGQYGK